MSTSKPHPPHPSLGAGTIAVRTGERTGAMDALVTPIACTATYAFPSSAVLADHHEGRIERDEYGRYGNPTVRAAEERIAALEGAEDSALFASGMAAITTTLLGLLKAGDHVILTSDCYRKTRQFAKTFLSRFGVSATLVAPDDLGALAAALRPETRVIFTESPTNPYLRVVDLPAFAALKRQHGRVKLLVDATFATPINQQPLCLGADLVLHSCTKYLGGHNDLLAGAVCGSRDLIAALRDVRGTLGGVLDPHAAYLLSRGIKTLALRVEQQNKAAARIARWLEGHPAVERVFYPGLQSHPDHAVAREQMKGFGGVISFLVRSDYAGTARALDACRLATIAPSLGGVETLIEQPAMMSFYELSTEERAAIGIADNLVRLSVGIEDEGDIVADLERALATVPKGAARRPSSGECNAVVEELHASVA